MPRAFSEREKELIRKRLLEEGYKQFCAYGLKKANVAEITRAVGISKGAFYLFYESKEALFMDVIEEAEVRVRRQVLATIDRPGPSPRARLYAVLKRALDLFEAIPILQFVAGSDYDVLFRRIPPEKLQQHVAADRAFFEELVTHCRNAGIPVRARPEQIVGLLYPLVLSILHKEDLSGDFLGGNTDIYLELIAAFALGQVDLQLQQTAPPAQEGTTHERND